MSDELFKNQSGDPLLVDPEIWSTNQMLEIVDHQHGCRIYRVSVLPWRESDVGGRIGANVAICRVHFPNVEMSPISGGTDSIPNPIVKFPVEPYFYLTQEAVDRIGTVSGDHTEHILQLRPNETFPGESGG